MQLQCPTVRDFITAVLKSTRMDFFNFFLFIIIFFLTAGSSPQKSLSARREQVPFSMAIGNGKLMHECFPKHPRMGTARWKLDNETEEEGKKRRINVERSTADTKETSPVQSPCRVVTSKVYRLGGETDSTIRWRKRTSCDVGERPEEAGY